MNAQRNVCLWLWGLSLLLTTMPAQAEWKTSLPGWTYEFPRDHGNHPDFKTEWWYFTGNLKTPEGREFGYQLTFFRQGVVPPGQNLPPSGFLTRDVKFAHFALTDLSGGRFHHFQRLSRGAFGEAGFEDGQRLVWIRDWECELTGTNSFRLRAREGGVEIRLELTSEKAPVFHGDAGVSQKSEGAGRGSHYYSLTRLNSRGEVILNGSRHAVEGVSWFDHEWATNQLAAHQVGWDWFSLIFDDGSELMLFQIRTREGKKDPFSAGTWVDPDGGTTHLSQSDFELTPIDTWTSPETGGRYPVAWQIEIPRLAFRTKVTARLKNQELVAAPFSYWEGAITAQGEKDGKPLEARGYLEMTGYSGEVTGLQSR